MHCKIIFCTCRTYIYYDAHLLDTFFDGGGDVNLALVASAIVARWAWSYIMTQGVNDVRSVRRKTAFLHVFNK